jgi:hypothetical protein
VVLKTASFQLLGRRTAALDTEAVVRITYRATCTRLQHQPCAMMTVTEAWLAASYPINPDLERFCYVGFDFSHVYTFVDECIKPRLVNYFSEIQEMPLKDKFEHIVIFLLGMKTHGWRQKLNLFLCKPFNCFCSLVKIISKRKPQLLLEYNKCCL